MRRLSLALLAGVLAVGVIAAPVAAKQPDPGMNIVKTALAVNEATGEFDTLTQLVVNLELGDALSARGKLTVFAPTDQAFLDIGITPEAVPALAADPATRAFLTDVVLYHVAKGNRDAASILGSSQIRMLNGDFAMVDAFATPYPTIDGAGIAGPNAAYASNGIIHVVDAVLLP